MGSTESIALDSRVVQLALGVIENESAVILEHRHYRGAMAPTRLVFDEAVKLKEYLAKSVAPGDRIWFWNYEKACLDATALAWGEVPNKDGSFPEAGSY